MSFRKKSAASLLCLAIALAAYNLLESKTYDPSNTSNVKSQQIPIKNQVYSHKKTLKRQRLRLPVNTNRQVLQAKLNYENQPSNQISPANPHVNSHTQKVHDHKECLKSLEIGKKLLEQGQLDDWAVADARDHQQSLMELEKQFDGELIGSNGEVLSRQEAIEEFERSIEEANNLNEQSEIVLLDDL